MDADPDALPVCTAFTNRRGSRGRLGAQLDGPVLYLQVDL
jgi:hypothetical protein